MPVAPELEKQQVVALAWRGFRIFLVPLYEAYQPIQHFALLSELVDDNVVYGASRRVGFGRREQR